MFSLFGFSDLWLLVFDIWFVGVGGEKVYLKRTILDFRGLLEVGIFALA